MIMNLTERAKKTTEELRKLFDQCAIDIERYNKEAEEFYQRFKRIDLEPSCNKWKGPDFIKESNLRRIRSQDCQKVQNTYRDILYYLNHVNQ